MKNGLTVMFLVTVIILPLTARELLVQWCPGADYDLTVVSHFPVVAELEDCYLLKVDEARLSALNYLPGALRILNLPADKQLFYVKTPAGFDRQQLARFGLVAGETPGGVLLATDETAIIGLNRLPVELCHLPLEPVNLQPAGPLPAPVSVSESLITALVARVNPDSVLTHIRRLQDFYTRYSTTESCRAAVEWMRERLAGYGCDSTALETYRTSYAPNVIGVKLGRVNPRPIYVICGHIDNTSDYAPEHCPGSDDNASGTAAVIEAARVFQDINFAYSVYFIGFTGEEQGLVGSDSFCRRAARRGDSIKAALNFDMISYGRQNLDSFEVIGKTSNPACAWLVDSFIASARTYTALKPVRRLVTSAPYSDHHSFWQRGYPALCGIEHDFTPMYHTIGDTIGPLYYMNCGTNNWLMATEAIKAAVATIAKLAGAMEPTGNTESADRSALLTVRPALLGKPPFHLPVRAGEQHWAVYDARGALVTTGASPVWDGRSSRGSPVAPGIYFLRSGSRTTCCLLVSP
ncbi:MAG: M28 family peptidase [candidate division WOR-3 bacterium]